jgi:hypothetical protein
VLNTIMATARCWVTMAWEDGSITRSPPWLAVQEGGESVVQHQGTCKLSSVPSSAGMMRAWRGAPDPMLQLEACRLTVCCRCAAQAPPS